MFAEILNSHCFTYSQLTNEQLPLGRLLVLLKGTYKKKNIFDVPFPLSRFSIFMKLQ